MRRPRPVVNRTNYELARDLVPLTEPLAELYRRWVAEEERLTATLGADEPPTFAAFCAWIVARGTRPPHRPTGRRDGKPSAHARRSAAQRARRRAEALSIAREVTEAAA